MGGLKNPFKGKTTTTVDKETVVQRLQRVVKLSYLQTLAISQGMTTAGDMVTETQSGTQDLKNVKPASEKFTDKPGNLFTPEGMLRGTGAQFGNGVLSNFGNKVGNATQSLGSIPGGNLGSGLVNKLLSGPINRLFGKSKTVTLDLHATETGWKIKRQWLAPEFDILRYAVGIRELQVSQFRYKEASEFVSRAWGSPKEIQKITLYVDQFVPGQFPPGDWIEYYVKPDMEGSDWMRINPLDQPTTYDDNGHIVPRIITFNTERPINSRIEESFVKTKEPVTTVRFRAVFKRPASLDTEGSLDAAGYSPVLKSYRLLLVPRGGL